MFEEKIAQANKEIKKVADYLKEHEDVFRSMDLKLHYAFYYFMSDEMKAEFPLTYEHNQKLEENAWSDFDWFCNDSYIDFKENLDVNYGIDFDEMQHRIGTTRRFYLHDDSTIDLDRYDGINTDTTIECFISKNNRQYGYCSVVDGKLEISDDYLNRDDMDCLKEVENELDYIIYYLDDEISEYCDDMINTYEVIQNFKNNQVEYFKEYLENQEYQLRSIQEEAERTAQEKKDHCVGIKEKYHISDEDMKTLQECISCYI